MFGSNNQQSADDPAMLDNVKQLAAQPADHAVPQQTASMPQDSGTPNFAFQSLQPASDTSQLPGSLTPAATTTQLNNYAPPQSMDNAQSPAPQVVTPLFSQPAESPAPQQNPTTVTVQNDTSSVPPVNYDKLADMKQEALSHLEPLVTHLDQNAEEEFKTTMMMIQANDNHTLLDKALAAARKIEDDKKRAEALLDIINEINYFSQNNQE